MPPAPPTMGRQYYGHFLRKRSIQHVVVETFGNTICQIIVSSTPHQTKFILGDYDETNKFQINGLLHVYDSLTTQTDSDIKSGKWRASIMQDWPGELRLIPEEPTY